MGDGTKTAHLEEKELGLLFLENAFEAVLVARLDGQIIYANPAAKNGLSAEGGALVGAGVTDVLDLPLDELKRITLRANPASGEEGVLTSAFSSRSMPVQVLLRGQRIDLQGEEHLMFLVRDVSTRMMIRKELQASQDLMARIVHGVADAIVALDGQGKVAIFNRGAEEIFGYSPKEILGQPLDILIPEQYREAHQGYMEEFSANKNRARLMGDRGSIAGRRKNGEVFPAEATVIRLENDGASVFVAVVRDISERKRIQDELKQARDLAETASRMKTAFLANMSHELRTPLNAIIGFSEFILEEHLGQIQPERYKAYVGDIHESGRHLLNIVNDILDLSRVEAGEMQLHEDHVDVKVVTVAAFRYLEGLAKKKSIALSVDLPEKLPYLWADERLFKQILINLISNAVKFTPESGDVRATARTEKDGSIAITIRDTGIGIAPEDIERVLQPFEQCEVSYAKKIEGTGLGLALAKSLMEMHGGMLTIESRVDHGTAITLRFPAERVQPLEAEDGEAKLAG